MSRPLRIEFEGAWYHVMNRGANRQDIFLQSGDYESFLRLLADCRKLWALEIHAYCLLKNHYHLLVRTPRGNLGRAMRHLDGVYTQYFNRDHKRDGPLFRGRYKAILVDAESYLLQVVRYIHLNPVTAKLAQLPEVFPWSSYRYYLDPRNSPSALERKVVLDQFGRAKDAIQQLKRFTLAGMDEETEKFYSRQRYSHILAKENFLARIKQMFLTAGPASPEIPKLTELIPRPPTIEETVFLVAQAYELPKQLVLAPKSTLARQARSAAIYLCRSVGGWPLVAIGRVFGGYKDSSIGSIVARMTQRLKDNGPLQSRLLEIEKALLQNQEKALTLTGHQMRSAET